MENKSKFKVILMGGNQIGCKILRHLFRMKDISIPLVVSNWGDNGSVVEHNAWNASLTRVALSKGLHVIQPFSIHSVEFLRDLKKIERPDLIITAEYEHYLNKSLLEFPRMGVINVHFSKLPRHRGAFPVIWSLMEDDDAGVTIHWVNDKVHGGDIIAQETIAITEEDTSFTIYNRLTQIGIKLFVQIFPKIIAGKAPRLKQNEDDASFHAAGYPNQSIIDWTDSAEKIRRLIYALFYPTARPATAFIRSGDSPIYLIPPARLIKSNSKKFLDPGTVVSIDENGVAVQTGEGLLQFERFSYNSFTDNWEKAEKIAQLFDIKVGSKFTIFNPLKRNANLNLIYSDYSNFIIDKQIHASFQTN